MTDSYNQEDINLRDADPILRTTIGIAPISAQVATVQDGGAIFIQLIGGGAGVLDPTANFYSIISVNATFTRLAGAAVFIPASGAVAPFGIAPVITFDIFDDTIFSQCFVTITPGPASPDMNHHYKLSRVVIQ